MKKCVERYWELAKKKIEQLYKVCTPCMDDHQFKNEELEIVRELSKKGFTNRPDMFFLSILCL